MEYGYGCSRSNLLRRGQQGLCVPCARRDAYTYANTDCNTNGHTSHTYADSYCDSNSNHYSNPDGYAYLHSYAHADD